MTQQPDGTAIDTSEIQNISECEQASHPILLLVNLAAIMPQNANGFRSSNLTDVAAIAFLVCGTDVNNRPTDKSLQKQTNSARW